MKGFENALDDRAESFMQVGTVARVIAEKHCEVLVDRTTHVRWQHTIGLLREVDTLADDTNIESEEVLERLEDFSEFAERYPSLTLDKLGSEVRNGMVNRTERVLRLGKHVAEATCMDRLIALRIAEGRLVAGYLEDVATPFVKDIQPGFHEKFMPVMKSMAVTANLLDSILDRNMDYRNGNISIVPMPEFKKALQEEIKVQRVLARQAILSHPAVMKEFVTMSWNRLINRVKHRDSRTSSLNLFRRDNLRTLERVNENVEV